MRVLRSVGLLFLCAFSFQNCGSFEAEESIGIYRFSTRPDFFSDIKLISLEIDEASRKRYVFDIAATFASNPNQAVTYRVQFSTLQFSGVCRTIDGSAEGPNKHFRAECLMPTQEDLFVQLTLVGPNDTQSVEQFRF